MEDLLLNEVRLGLDPIVGDQWPYRESSNIVEPSLHR
jgi:hypothetical protein